MSLSDCRQAIDSRVIHDQLQRAQALGLFDTSDPSISLFHTSLQSGAPMQFKRLPSTCDSDVNPLRPVRVLEVGCCESDWLQKAHEAWPNVELVGVDWRAPNVIDGDGKVTRKQGDGIDPYLFTEASFDGIVSLSAIEHFGLGHYDADPLDPDGDTRIVANCWKWLKPGGWLYFDVPYDPRGYRVHGTEYRVYDDRALTERLYRQDDVFNDDWRGYASSSNTAALIQKPTAGYGLLPYYVAMVWTKPSGFRGETKS